MRTLHELATLLQGYIIDAQEDPHNETSMSINRYNNLKLRMETKIKHPNVVVTIGISEAIYNIKDFEKTEGGLGPDEKYVNKWLNSPGILFELNQIYVAMIDLLKTYEEGKRITIEGESDEVKKEAPKKKKGFKGLIEASSLTAMPLDRFDALKELMETPSSQISDNDLIINNAPAKPVIKTSMKSYSKLSEESPLEKSSSSKTSSNNKTSNKKGIKDYLKSMFKKN